MNAAAAVVMQQNNCQRYYKLLTNEHMLEIAARLDNLDDLKEYLGENLTNDRDIEGARAEIITRLNACQQTMLNVGGSMGELLNKALPNLHYLINLREMQFNNINLSNVKFPDSFANLQLDKLSFRYNQMTTIPKAVCNMVSLRYLIVENNKIKTVPDEINNLINLEKLDLDYNLMEVIPHNIDTDKMIRLQRINLSNNKINFLRLKDIKIVKLFGTLDTLKKQKLNKTDKIFIHTQLVEKLHADCEQSKIRMREVLAEQGNTEEQIERLIPYMKTVECITYKEVNSYYKYMKKNHTVEVYMHDPNTHDKKLRENLDSAFNIPKPTYTSQQIGTHAHAMPLHVFSSNVGGFLDYSDLLSLSATSKTMRKAITKGASPTKRSPTGKNSKSPSRKSPSKSPPKSPSKSYMMGGRKRTRAHRK